MTEDTIACSCVTCSDRAVDMTVIALTAELALATCVDEDGGISEVDLGLVDDITLGTRLLVHAGTAIAITPVAGR